MRIGYKVVKMIGQELNYAIIKLQILGTEHQPSQGVTKKLRTNKAKVLDVRNLKGEKIYSKKFKSAYSSIKNRILIYEIGKIVTAKLDKSENCCGSGINYFASIDNCFMFLIYFLDSKPNWVVMRDGCTAREYKRLEENFKPF